MGYPRSESIEIFNYEYLNLNDYKCDNQNDNSIVLYGEFNYMNILLMGDVSSKVERNIVIDHPGLEVDIIKVSHHGSKYSTCQELLDEYHPKIAILSYGYNNYGHPSLEVVNRLKRVGSRIYSTNKDGTLIFFSNYEKEIYLRILK